jgi:hypothetical protein
MRRFGLLSLLLLSACSSLGQHAVMSVDEYAEYRRFRLAPSVEQKLSAGFDYLKANPRGAFHSEVSSWFKRVQRDYVEQAWNEPVRLEALLAVAPEGPEAERAAARLVELRLTREYHARHERAFDERVARMERRLASAESGRRELVSGIRGWVRHLSAIRSWGQRTSELDPELIFAYRLSEPGARCNDDGCSKTMMVSYDVPEGKAQSERQAIYDVGLRLEKGGVRAAFVSGPELFTRLGEAVRVAAVSPSDLVGRMEAIGQAVQVLALAVEPVLPASRCAAESVSPVVLRRVCDGVDFRVISAVELGDEDRIVVEPSAAVVAPIP